MVRAVEKPGETIDRMDGRRGRSRPLDHGLTVRPRNPPHMEAWLVSTGIVGQADRYRWPEENIETAALKLLFKSNHHARGFML
jgi:hypothetical protein